MSILPDLKTVLPIELSSLSVGQEATGLIIVDEVNGFVTVGAGNLAPKQPNAKIDQMVLETNRLAHYWSEQKWPMLVFLDSHNADHDEPPYPPHCQVGTGEENLVSELLWLEQDPQTTLIRKDCINGYIGASLPDGTNVVLDWLNAYRLKTVIVMGICTDICVMDFVLTLLSVRNHKLAPFLKHIAVYEPACATYDLPMDMVKKDGLPLTASHPQDLTHHLGLYFMASRGAILLNKIEFA
ncbi:MAG: isochorismatase family protein [Alphaproteobacteria bacterium]|nr:isochorismatase family protein [Alphaproteobacteria bacterium]